MAKKLFVNILVLLTFFNLKSYAQNPTNQISASSSKNYETQAIKNNNQIEIRLIPKNTPPQKVDKPQEAISENFVNEESSSKTTKKDPKLTGLGLVYDGLEHRLEVPEVAWNVLFCIYLRCLLYLN